MQALFSRCRVPVFVCLTEKEVSELNTCRDCPLQTGGPHDYHIKTADGQVLIREYPVFPGIWLAFKEAYTYAFPHHADYPGGLLEITHCREGRLEYQAPACSFFLGQGDLSLHATSPENAVLRCPVKRYGGLSIIIDPRQAPPCTSCFLSEVKVQLPELHRTFCEQEGHIVIRPTPQLEALFDQLYQVPAAIRTGYYQIKVLELLLLLSSLEPSRSQWQQHTCTPAQARLAREVIAYTDRHRSEAITTSALAKALHATPEQLRYSVQRVYGKPLYQCIRAYKMRLAAELLRTTGRTVLDVAAEFGYANGSKFAAAFRNVLGVGPAEYRLTAEQKKCPDLEP